jgi:hypothetical protein
MSKIMALWSIKMSESLGFKNSHILTRSATLQVITRSRMFSALVGVVFSCSKKKSFNNLINEFSLTSKAFHASSSSRGENWNRRRLQFLNDVCRHLGEKFQIYQRTNKQFHVYRSCYFSHSNL